MPPLSVSLVIVMTLGLPVGLWSELVTAVASHVPPPLVRQLKPGGRMVIPVGPRFLVQFLTIVEKRLDGSVIMREILPVLFVPLTGDH